MCLFLCHVPGLTGPEGWREGPGRSLQLHPGVRAAGPLHLVLWLRPQTRSPAGVPPPICVANTAPMTLVSFHNAVVFPSVFSSLSSGQTELGESCGVAAMTARFEESE